MLQRPGMNAPAAGLDFETLTLKDALDLAVLIEEEARDRYVELAGQLRIHQSAAAAAFFERMAGAEELHRAGLLEHRQMLFGDQPRQVSSAQLIEVEAPRYDDARLKLTLRQALEAAMRAEEKARAFFERALISVKNPEVAKLFAELMAEEIEHRRLVGAELALVAPELPPFEAARAAS